MSTIPAGRQQNKSGSVQKTKPMWLAVTLVLIISLVYVSPAAAQSVSPLPDSPAQMAAFLDGVLAAGLADQHVPGAVVVVVKDGEVLFSKGYGFADVEGKISVDPASTLFRPGSISKLFTWTAVMQLVEQGKLSLDADINDYLDFQIPDPFGQPIKLRHLMTHTAGFEDQGNGLFKQKPEELMPLKEFLMSHMPARVFEPGKIAAYSNYGTALAGYIVERVSGMPFTEYIEKNIFAPLGMSHSTFRQPLPADLAANMANGYGYRDGEFLKGEFEYILGLPAGALSASGLDMAKFMIAHLQNGRYGEAQILQQSTAFQMHSPLYSADPRMDGLAHGFFFNHYHGQYIISHGGDTFLFPSGLYLLPEHNFGLFISTNGSNGNRVVETVQKAFLDRYFPGGDPPALIPVESFSTRISDYSGSYKLARSSFTTLEKIITLMTPVSVQVDEQDRVVISLMGNKSRFIEVEPGLLVNIENPDNKLVLKVENGQVYLHPVSPFVLMKLPWYGQLPLQLLIFVGGMLTYAVSMLGWLASWVRRLRKGERMPPNLRAARVLGGFFGLVYLVFLAVFGAQFSNVSPVYGVPKLFFGIPDWFNVILALPIVMVALALAMVFVCVRIWLDDRITLRDRLGYSLLTIFSAGIVWGFTYWNLL